MEPLYLIFIVTVYYIIGIIATTVYEFLTKNMEIRIFNIKFHHSMWGIIGIIIGLLLHNFFSPIYLITIGISVIIQHTVNEKRFVFID